MAYKVEEPHFFVSDSDPLVVDFSNRLGCDDEAGFCRGGADEIESFVDAGERLASPVSTDLAKQAVFDGIPLGSAGRVVADGDLEPSGVQMVS